MKLRLFKPPIKESAGDSLAVYVRGAAMSNVVPGGTVAQLEVFNGTVVYADAVELGSAVARSEFATAVAAVCPMANGTALTAAVLKLNHQLPVLLAAATDSRTDSATDPRARNSGNCGISDGSQGVVTMNDVASESVQWLWKSRVPLGKVTVIEGDPDQGKSLMTLDMAARGSTGRAMVDGSASDLSGPWSTILLTAEDGLADTVRPRLEAASANLSLIHVLDSVPDEEKDGEWRPPELPRDVPYLRQAIEARKAKFVVIDVIMAYLGGDVKAISDQDIRRALRPLARLAEELGVAIVVLRHLTKGGGANPLYRGGGAIGLGGAARSVMLAGNDPKVPGRHLLARVKGNLALPYPTLAYEILGDLQGRPYIRWGGESLTGAAEMLAAAELAARDASEDHSISEEFVLDMLAGGERDGADVISEGEKRGLKYKQIWKASHKVGVIRRFDGVGADGRWKWSLPHKGSKDSTVSTDSTVSGPRISAGISAGNSAGNSANNGVAGGTERQPWQPAGHEWEEVPSGVICPPGLEYHLVLGGKRTARWPAAKVCADCGKPGRLVEVSGYLLHDDCSVMFGGNP